MHSGAAVRAVGQIELVLSIAITILAFKQKITKIELTGVILLLASILLVVLN
jgi:drug/metabolite transporter (DMT)-like permease